MDFSVYLDLGFDHILDPRGYDHILFIVALCAQYRPADWRRLAILVTAFTVGHSLTLAAATLEWIDVSQTWVEFLIPVTIFLTAIYNVTARPRRTSNTPKPKQRVNWYYALALFFGLIHGLGFSNFLRSSLLPGEESELVTQLLAFNLGVELGQLAIVGVLLLIGYVVLSVARVRRWDWNLFISGAAAGPALIMSLERWPF